MAAPRKEEKATFAARRESRISQLADAMRGLPAWLEYVKAQSRMMLWRGDNIARSNYELGQAALQGGRLNEAIFRFRLTMLLDRAHTALPNYQLGRVYMRRGERELAVQYFRKALRQLPAHEESRFLLSMLDPGAFPKEQQPSTMPLSLVVDLFDSVAPTYDSEQERNDYKGPQFLHKLVFEHMDRARTDYTVLDLGCGTGLTGQQFRSQAVQQVGIDVARGMIREAHNAAALAGPVYDVLHPTDIRRFLAAQTEPQFDIVTAQDVFAYVGELTPVFAGVARTLKPGGAFAFSVEEVPGPVYGLVRALGRFGHSPEYLQQLAARYGFAWIASGHVPDYPTHTVLQCLLQRV